MEGIWRQLPMMPELRAGLPCSQGWVWLLLFGSQRVNQPNDDAPRIRVCQILSTAFFIFTMLMTHNRLFRFKYTYNLGSRT